MALGLLGAAMAGGAEAAQDNARERLQDIRQRGILRMRKEFQQEIADTEWQRKQEAASASATREDQQRLQDRQWELEDANKDHARAIQLQNVRNQGGYGNRPTAKQREAQWLVDNGIASSLEEAWPMVSSRNDSGAMDYIDNRLSELRGALEDPDFEVNFNGTEAELSAQRERMREELSYYQNRRDQIASERYGLQPPSSSSSSVPAPQASPPSAALNFLRSNNTPEVRQQFQAKYGYLPEGIQ